MVDKVSIVFLNIRAKAQKGGQEATINNIINGIKDDYDVIYVGHPSDVDYKAVKFPFTPILKLVPIKRGFGKLLKISVFRYLFLRKIKFNCDLIVMNGKSDYTFLIRNKNLINYGKVLVIKHGKFIKPYPDIITKNKEYRIVVLNSNELHKLENIYSRKNLRLIRTGIKKDNIEGDIDVRQKLSIPKNAYVILSIGRLEETQKKFSAGIRAIKLAIQNNQNLFYIIIGDGINKRYYQRLIKKLGLLNNVKLLGRLSEEDKNGLLRTSNLLLITSSWETLGLTMVEAFRAGLPVLTTKTDGSTDVIEEGHNGFYTTGEPEDISNKILMINKLPKDKLEEVTENAMETAEIYSYDKMIDSYKATIKELINDKNY